MRVNGLGMCANFPAKLLCDGWEFAGETFSEWCACPVGTKSCSTERDVLRAQSTYVQPHFENVNIAFKCVCV